MSVQSVIYINDDKLPSVGVWQAALDTSGTAMKLEDVGDLRSHSGFLPVTYNGKLSGFEWYYDQIAEPTEGVDRTHTALLVTHSDAHELYCALIAGAILAQISDGLVWDDENELISAPEAWLRVAEDVKKHLK